MLLQVNKFGIVQDIGLFRIATCVLLDRKLPLHLQSDIFALLRKVKNDSKQDLYDIHNLPDLYQDLYKGAVTSEEAIRLCFDKAEELWKQDQTRELHDKPFFTSIRQKELIKSGVKAMFDPVIIAKNAYTIKPIAAFVKECAEVLDNEGNPIHRQFILSNFAGDTFDELMKQGHCADAFISIAPNDRIISGKIGLIKPDPSIFKYLLDTYRLKAEDCIFIDDKLENIESAKALGITTIHLAKPDPIFLRKQLLKLGVL